MKEIPLERFSTKKVPAPVCNGPKFALSWEVRVPMLTNPVFMKDAMAAFMSVWFFPSCFGAVVMDFAEFDRDSIFFVVSWIGMCVALLAGVSFFFMLVRFNNSYYARYTLSGGGIACEIAHNLDLHKNVSHGKFFSCRAVPIPAGSLLSIKTEKWVTWDKIHKIGTSPTLRIVTLSDAFFPVFRIYCPDDETFTRTLELCEDMLERGKDKN
jgi:hypothetical protein